jgi:molybdate transport system substrate-binding protein
MLSRIIVLVRTSFSLVALAILLVACNAAPSDPVRIAVAANFTAMQEKLAARFTERTGVPVESSFGATGALYSQIANGAPFQVFLSADAERPERLEREGLTAPGSRFTYALGALVLYAPGGFDGGNGEEALRRGAFQHLAICKPALAPYGLAAQQTLEKLGLWDGVQPGLVQGDNVTQVYQYVETGNAEMGFVALSQVNGLDPDQLWHVPAALHAPIRQDAVLLKTGAEHEGARAFLAFLQGPEARQMIAAGGYALPEEAK